MKKDSLAELKAAFIQWRKNKRYIREVIPNELLERARRAIPLHGLNNVLKATSLDYYRLIEGMGDEPNNRAPNPAVDVKMPPYTKVELVVPSAKDCPIAEVETPSGLKLRIFKPTQEILGLLSSMCKIGEVP
jgi:hypothetical protein